MTTYYKYLLAILISIQAFAETIPTFYGSIEVDEPVLIELIHAPAMQRLKSIHQYGVNYYTSHREEYNRFDHSIGVFAVLRLKGASLEEQIAGLLHDASHTVFSHVGDWVFGKEYQETDYQSMTHGLYLAASGLESILMKHGYTAEQISPKRDHFTMLEQSLPNLSADRIDYNIQGAYFQNFITREEANQILGDLRFEEGRWVATHQDLMSKLALSSLFLTETCWGSAANYLSSRWLADAILRGLKIGLLSWRSFHFGVDDEVWDRLYHAEDPIIRQKMHMLTHVDEYFRIVPPAEADVLVKFRCRGIDPWIERDGSIVRLSSIDLDVARRFREIKAQANEGWALKVLQETN